MSVKNKAKKKGDDGTISFPFEIEVECCEPKSILKPQNYIWTRLGESGH